MGDTFFMITEKKEECRFTGEKLEFLYFGFYLLYKLVMSPLLSSDADDVEVRE